MICEFDKCELINGGLLGLFTSAIIAFATYKIVTYNDKSKLRKRYGVAEGNDYKGYGFLNDSNSKETWVLNDNPTSSAKIKYIKDNILFIELTHDLLTWTGEIIMNSESSGTVAFRYINLPKENGKEQHQFGLKNIIIRNNEDEEYVYVYLIGNKLDGYGKEVLIRRKNR